MTELTQEHFELIDKNRAEMHERKKIQFLEDRIKTLETAIESHAKILARFNVIETIVKEHIQPEIYEGDNS